MSLIGLDIGSSAAKAVAFDVEGRRLAGARVPVTANRPMPGSWEVDPREMRAAALEAIALVAADPRVRNDPPVAIGISASGREVFPVGGDGEPLGPCIMAGDSRGADIAARTAARRTTAEWFDGCGHVPGRMDPVNRILWWRTNDPDTFAGARWFLGWHEYLSLVLCGSPSTCPSLAGPWLAYEFSSDGWSADRLGEVGLDPGVLPTIVPSGHVIDTIGAVTGGELGLPARTAIVSGAFDAVAAAIGCGALEPGQVALACGSWETFVLPVGNRLGASVLDAGMVIVPYPGPTRRAILAANPNGTVVLDWFRQLSGLTLEDLEAHLATAGAGPSSATVHPRLSAPADARFDLLPGGLIGGLTLATTAPEIAQAIMEGVAVELSDSLEAVRAQGIPVDLTRASGGGSRSSWWMQLKADLTRVPIETLDQAEPGALGAMMFAGLGTGTYRSLEEARGVLLVVKDRYEPGRNFDRMRVLRERNRAATSATAFLSGAR